MFRKLLFGVTAFSVSGLGAAARDPGAEPPAPGSAQTVLLGHADAPASPYSAGAQNGLSDAPHCADNCNGSFTTQGTGPCGPQGRLWASAELLLWWARPQHVPPLLTSGTGAANPGILGQPGTTVLFGGDVNGGLSVGGRFRAGMWLDDCHTCGLEGSFFFLGSHEDELHHVCQPGDVVSRPFFNTATGLEDAELVCLPGVVTGDVSIRSTSQFLGADINFRKNLCCTCSSRVDLLFGFRYLHLEDDISIQENLTNLSPQVGVVGEGFIVRDRFHTNNNFYGGQVGLAGELRSGRVFLDWRTMIGLGVTTRDVTISGSTTFIDPVTPLPTVTQPGGLLAQPSNIGSHPSSGFSFVPELALNLGYQVAPHTRAWVGYTFLYWSNVARAGEQINPNVDPNQLPSRAGPGVGVDPKFIFHPNDFWAQGVSLGLEFRY